MDCIIMNDQHAENNLVLNPIGIILKFVYCQVVQSCIFACQMQPPQAKICTIWVVMCSVHTLNWDEYSRRNYMKEGPGMVSTVLLGIIRTHLDSKR